MTRFSGPALRQRRTAAGKSREQLAIEVDRSVPSIASYELGRVLPSLDVLGRIADALDCSVGDLFDAPAAPDAA